MKITAKDRAAWLMRKDTEVYQFGLEVSTGYAWAARVVNSKFEHREIGRGHSKETAVNEAIRAERAAKKGKKK